MTFFRTMAVGAMLTGMAQAALAEAHGGLVAAQARWEAAFNSGSPEAAADMYTEDALLLPPDAPLIQGKAAIGDFWGGVMGAGAHSLDLEFIDHEMLGDTAIEIGTWSVKGPWGKDGAEVQIGGKAMVVWKQQADGGWLMAADIWNDDPAPE